MLEPGQSWRSRTIEEPTSSRLVIGAILTFENRERIICVSVIVSDAQGDGASLPFLPLSETAFMASVTEVDGMGEVAASFADELARWRDDPRGLSVFTVPFEGNLDRTIARQMQAILAERNSAP